jgi:hypothetical protein
VVRDKAVFTEQSLGLLTPARNYSCRVSARNSIGWSKPSMTTLFWTMSDLPEVAVSPHMEAIGRYYAEVHWKKPRHNGLPILGYDVEIKRPGSQFEVIDDCDDTTSVECKIGTLLPGDTYLFRISSENCAGRSQYAPIVTLRTLSAPPDPTTNLQLAAVDPRNMTLAWTTGRDNGAPIVAHAVECDGGYTCFSGPWLRPNPPPCYYTGNDTLKDSEDPTTEDNQPKFRIAWYGKVSNGATTTAHLTPVRPATTYRCRTYAINSEGFSNATDPYLF